MNYDKRQEAVSNLITGIKGLAKKAESTVDVFYREEQITFTEYLDGAVNMLSGYETGAFEPEYEDKMALRALRHTLQTLNDLNGRMNLSEREVNDKEDMLDFLDIKAKITELISQLVSLQRDIVLGEL